MLSQKENIMSNDIDKKDLKNSTTIELIKLVEQLKKERDEAQVIAKRASLTTSGTLDNLHSLIKSAEEERDNQLEQNSVLEIELSNTKLEQNQTEELLKRSNKQYNTSESEMKKIRNAAQDLSTHYHTNLRDQKMAKLRAVLNKEKI